LVIFSTGNFRHRHSHGSARKRFCDSAKSDLVKTSQLGAEQEPKEMSRISFAVLIALGLAFTGYFAVAAWQVSEEDRTEFTGTVMLKNR
jgi:hypothetical protein